MPGVYIHKIGQFDWLEQQKESVLNVPGSYWLCHKNSIYKFTFRYHRTDRNTKEFAYRKELMKVVRRIIKSQPRQGQQFCTKHILATYILLDHTSWTRQDKMFAMLKFREHTNVATVPQAIMLTVKVFKNENSVPNDIFHTKIEQEAIQSLIHIKEDYSNRDTENDNNVNVESSSTDELKINSVHSDKHVYNLNLSLSSSVNINNSNITDKSKIIKNNRKFPNVENKSVHKSEGCSESFEERAKVNEYHNNIEMSSLLNQLEFNKTTEEKNKAQVNINSTDDINGVNDESVIDSANLPYQYFIEKEIENAKNKTVPIPLLDINKSIPIHVNNKEEYTKNIKCISTGAKEWENTYHKTVKADYSKCKNTGELQKKIVSDDNALKSSNITDLIMRGCMFTIQQDKDSVSVLEQKTKSDVDEVLENSEKAETKEGEKCLLNSSLLKLENLVTMIEAPKENISTYKSKITMDNNIPLHSTLSTKNCITNQHITKSASIIGPSTLSFNSQNIPTQELFDKSIVYDKKHKLNIKETTTNNRVTVLENNETDGKSIISEIKQPNNDAQSVEMKKNYLQTNSLLDSNKSILKNYINNGNSEVGETTVDTTSNHIFNTPRIISNEIITVDQMPSRLRKIVKRKLSRTKAPTNSTHKLNPEDAQPDTTQLELCNESANLEEKYLDTKSESNSVVNCSNALSLYSSVNVVKEITRSRKKRKRSHDQDTKNDNSLMKNNETIPLIQEKIYSSIDKTERHKRRKKQQDCEYDTEKKVKMPAHIYNIVKQKYSIMPSKLQDITEEFYQDLMQHRSRNKIINCKDRKQTRESLYLDADVENENIRIEMLKFIEDITRGVKVVVKRMSTKSISSILGKSSSLACAN